MTKIQTFSDLHSVIAKLGQSAESVSKITEALGVKKNTQKSKIISKKCEQICNKIVNVLTTIEDFQYNIKIVKTAIKEIKNKIEMEDKSLIKKHQADYIQKANKIIIKFQDEIKKELISEKDIL